MRLAALLVLAALQGASALAADAPPPTPAAAEPPICTTTTVVERRGDVVLSTRTSTKCEDPNAPPGLNPAAVLAAPAAMLGALAGSGGDGLTPKNTAGDWRVVDGRTGDVCHLVLSVRTTAAGFVARGATCPRPLREAEAWIYRDGAAEVMAPGGRLIVRLTGTRDQLSGAADGDVLTLQR